ncbi:unnamed protein product [Rangifer tarandus platyrhynchus]|uniref:Uncharacterized protein n=1 Tax=Rangifer tarandus platyrhynchus TaxID=3082113 RepID=A0AC59ZYM9_RANTA
MGRAMFNRSLIQFPVDGWSCVPSVLFTWGQTMVEVMKIMVTSLKRSLACAAAVRAPALQQATANPRLCQRLRDTHRRVSCGVTVPSSWVLLHKALLCPPRVCSQPCVSSGSSVVGSMLTSSKRAYATPTPRAPVPAADHCRPAPPQETPKHSSVSVSVGSLGPGAHKVCLSPLSVCGRNGV